MVERFPTSYSERRLAITDISLDDFYQEVWPNWGEKIPLWGIIGAEHETRSHQLVWNLKEHRWEKSGIELKFAESGDKRRGKMLSELTVVSRKIKPFTFYPDIITRDISHTLFFVPFPTEELVYVDPQGLKERLFNQDEDRLIKKVKRIIAFRDFHNNVIGWSTNHNYPPHWYQDLA